MARKQKPVPVIVYPVTLKNVAANTPYSIIIVTNDSVHPQQLTFTRLGQIPEVVSLEPETSITFDSMDSTVDILSTDYVCTNVLNTVKSSATALVTTNNVSIPFATMYSRGVSIGSTNIWGLPALGFTIPTNCPHDGLVVGQNVFEGLVYVYNNISYYIPTDFIFTGTASDSSGSNKFYLARLITSSMSNDGSMTPSQQRDEYNDKYKLNILKSMQTERNDLVSGTYYANSDARLRALANRQSLYLEEVMEVAYSTLLVPADDKVDPNIECVYLPLFFDKYSAKLLINNTTLSKLISIDLTVPETIVTNTTSYNLLVISLNTSRFVLPNTDSTFHLENIQILLPSNTEKYSSLGIEIITDSGNTIHTTYMDITHTGNQTLGVLNDANSENNTVVCGDNWTTSMSAVLTATTSTTIYNHSTDIITLTDANHNSFNISVNASGTYVVGSSITLTPSNQLVNNGICLIVQSNDPYLRPTIASINLPNANRDSSNSDYPPATQLAGCYGNYPQVYINSKGVATTAYNYSIEDN